MFPLGHIAFVMLLPTKVGHTWCIGLILVLWKTWISALLCHVLLFISEEFLRNEESCWHLWPDPKSTKVSEETSISISGLWTASVSLFLFDCIFLSVTATAVWIVLLKEQVHSFPAAKERSPGIYKLGCGWWLFWSQSWHCQGPSSTSVYPVLSGYVQLEL